MTPPRTLALATVAVCTLVATAANADDSTASDPTVLDDAWDRLGLDDVPEGSPYREHGELELQTIERGLNDLELEPEHDPWGRTVCAIHQRTYPIFLEEDLLPTWLNLFHRQTRERVVARANTIELGDPFDANGWEDSERAIRDPTVFSVVAVVPVRSDEADCVDVMIVTRDVWTLKPSWSVETNGRSLTSLFFGVTEYNILGTADALSLGVTRTLGSWSIGPTYLSRHFAGSRITVYESFDVLVDRETGELEGTRNAVQVARPLHDSHARWAWSVGASHEFAIRRRYTGDTLDSWTVGNEEVPERYRVRAASGAATVTRAWGEQYKVHLTPGFRVTWRDYEPVPRDPTISPAALEAFERERLPRSELAVGPTLGAKWFRNEYFRLVDYESYGISEEVREGALAGISLHLAEPTLGSDERFVTVYTNFLWRVRLGHDAFFATGFERSMRADGGVGDVSVSGSARLVTPRAFLGRFVARVVATELRRNGGNTILSIGGGTGLRGYPIGYLKGTRAFLGNVEWRSRPLRIRQVRMGGVLSYDVGAAWERNDPVVYYPSVGFGVRLVLPATGTVVRAGDVSFPLRPFGSPLVSLGLEQAF